MIKLFFLAVISCTLSPLSASKAKAELGRVSLRNGVYQVNQGFYCDFLLVKDESGQLKKLVPQNPSRYPQAYCYDTRPRLVRCDLHPSPSHLNFCALKIEGSLALGWMRILDDSGFALVDDKLEDILYYFRQ